MTPTQPQLDLAELRRLAEAATPIWGAILTEEDGDKQLEFQRAANPQTILRLLDLLTPGALAAALVEVEDDGWFGPDYTPGRTAEAILAALAERSAP